MIHECGQVFHDDDPECPYCGSGDIAEMGPLSYCGLCDHFITDGAFEHRRMEQEQELQNAQRQDD